MQYNQGRSAAACRVRNDIRACGAATGCVAFLGNVRRQYDNIVDIIRSGRISVYIIYLFFRWEDDKATRAPDKTLDVSACVRAMMKIIY